MASSEVARGHGAVREVELHRRVAIISPGVIQVRPSRRALVRPLIGFLAGVLSFAGIVLGLHTLPLGLLMVLLLVAVVCIPLAGIGLVYALIGAHVVIDREKQSATWQQGLTGLGIGTQELVPFWKIAAITVEEAGVAAQGSGSPTEEFAQWQVVLDKTSGKRLVIGQSSTARTFSAEALARASEVATAIAELTGAPLRLPETRPSASTAPVSGPATAVRRARHARRKARRR